MYTTEGRVRFSECSAKGRLSVGGLIDYFQDTSTFHAEDVGMGQEYLRQNDRAWIINYWQVEIGTLPKLGEKIRVETWPYMFRKFIGNRNYVLKDEAGQVCARADSIWALYDMKKGFPASMTKEELILELVRSKIREARLKKGYEVKGDGAEKVFIPLSSKNTK